MTIDSAEFGQRIARMRELKSLSISALADESGLAKSYLAKIERGEVPNPGLRTLSVIASALGVTVADLLPPAQPDQRPARPEVLDEEAEVRRVMANLPPGLGEFLKRCEANGERVPLKAIQALSMVEFRGRRPEKPEDWQFLYDAMRRSVRP